MNRSITPKVKHMSIKLPDQQKKRLYIISFIVLPILFLIGFFISLRVGKILNYNVDNRAATLLAFSFVPLYLLSLFTAYRVLKNQSKE
jgi:hypothetical protein